MDKIDEILTRGVANIIPSYNELGKILQSGKKLNVYFGIDPTATKIHLGHAVPLRKLQGFAKAGHNVTFLIGDFTALIGDTSDKDSERPVLTPGEIAENFKTYKKQAEKILDFSKIKVRYNSQWLNKLSFPEIVRLTQQFSFGDFASRELIRNRLKQGKRVGLHEGLYPAMQGYDSYFMDADIQLGGTDQTFNMQAGRLLQRNWRNKESFIITTQFLTGTDGRKMSKSWGNAIWLDDTPEDMYIKIMSIKDELIAEYYALATNTPLEEIKKIEQEIKNANPMRLKENLASKIVAELYDQKTSKKAAAFFSKTVQHKELPQDMPIYQYASKKKTNIIDLLIKTKLTTSKSEAKRLIEQNGVSLNNKLIDNPNVIVELKDEQLLKVGKRKYVRIRC
ncbi:tyrosine--tRNA ligase [Patescibacteria group bacterium]|nr:tyrosine--tRNA ligase [Patescibacteria group bacterium]MCL5010370.1 tyrosine--tRNA ligase [Patescibacteria group bacterium]